MIGLSLESVKKSIVDRQRVQDAMEQASLRALSRFGAFVRQRAKTSLNKSKKPAPPGHAPNSHTGLIRDHILFLVERAEHNVVIGPMKLNKPSGTALAALEHGGPSLIMRHGKPLPITVAARPFMQPAFDKELAKAPQLWENAFSHNAS